MENDNWQEIDQSRNCPMHGVLSRDNEIKEQFLGRWLEIEPKCHKHVDWPKPVKLLTPDVPNPEVLNELEMLGRAGT